MIRLATYQENFYSELSSYTLGDEQAQFTGDIDHCINVSKDTSNPQKIIVVILSDAIPVGFFVLDKGSDKSKLTDNDLSLLIRSLSLKPDCQGRGIGTQAMLLTPDFVNEELPEINELVLSVNCKNEHAYRMYMKAGFKDTQRTIIGPMGEQYVLTKNII